MILLIDYEPLCAVFSYIGILRKIYKFGTSSTDIVKLNDFIYPQHNTTNKTETKSLRKINELKLINDACHKNKFAQFFFNFSKSAYCSGTYISGAVESNTVKNNDKMSLWVHAKKNRICSKFDQTYFYTNHILY